MRRTIRYRITVTAAAVVAVVMTLAGVVILGVQRAQLTANLDHSLGQRADLLTSELAVSAESEIPNTNPEDRLVQLVGPDGNVLAATSNVSEFPALPVALTARQVEGFRTVDNLPIEDDTFRLLTRRIDTSSGPSILHVAENIDDVNSSIRILSLTLLATVPAVVAAMSALIWWLVGRTLKPVEAIRTEVAGIGGTELHRRVPVPGSDDEIARLASTMNAMLDRVETAQTQQQRFVADASHELRSPLARLRTELEVNLAGGDTDWGIAAPGILDETIRLQYLVTDLLEIARTDAGATEGSREPVDLDDIVLREVRRLRADDRVRVDASAVSAAHVNGDPLALTRVIRNLTDNARRHAVAVVTVTLTEIGDEVLLTVADDGPGIPPEQRDRIFDRFARLDEARSAADGGTGLGLAITRDIVERHGGTIELQPDPGPGARFVVRIPAASAPS